MLKKYPSQIYCALLTLASLALMLAFADGRSMWYDDLATIAYAAPGQTWAQHFEHFMRDAVSNPPLFYVLAVFWLRIAPFGTFWLMLPSILLTAAGMYLCGVVARKLTGNDAAAVFTTLFAATSWFMITQGAFTFRSYGLLFLLSILYTYVYILRLERPQHWLRHALLLGLLAALLGYTHYFGLFVAFFFFLRDGILLAMKKLQWRQMLAYPVAGLLYFPYFVPVFMRVVEAQGAFWAAPPNLRMVFEFALNMVSHSDLVAVALLVGVALLAAPLAERWLDFSWEQVFLARSLAFVVEFTIVLVFVYSRFVNPSGSLFVDRYFIAILPQVLMLAGLGAAQLARLGPLKNRLWLYALVGLMALPLYGNAAAQVFRHARTYHQPFREAADWIYHHPQAHEPGTLVLIRGYPRGFLYYFSQEGRRRTVAVYGCYSHHRVQRFIEETHADWQRIFRFDGHGQMSAEVLATLERHFELAYVHHAWDSRIYIYRRR